MRAGEVFNVYMYNAQKVVSCAVAPRARANKMYTHNIWHICAGFAKHILSRVTHASHAPSIKRRAPHSFCLMITIRDIYIYTYTGNKRLLGVGHQDQEALDIRVNIYI